MKGEMIEDRLCALLFRPNALLSARLAGRGGQWGCAPIIKVSASTEQRGDGRCECRLFLFQIEQIEQPSFCMAATWLIHSLSVVCS